MFDRQNGIIVRTDFQQPDPTGPTGVFNHAFVQSGVVPAARLGLATDMSDGDTISIGGSSFTFKTTLVAATTTTQVKRGTSAAATLAALVHAINGVSDPLVVPNTTPFAASVVADSVSTSLRIRLATARGGLPIAGVSGSLALASTTTPVANIWSAANLNASGKSPGDCQATAAKFTVTAGMVTNGGFQLELPFTPTVYSVYVTSSAGVLRSVNEAIVISGNALSFTFAGGASPNFQSGDLVYVEASA